MLGLVQAEFGAAGERERGDETEAGVADRGAELYATLFEIGDGGIDVVAQEVKLVVASLLSWVHADFGGREAENEPAVASVDVGEFERVAEESAYWISSFHFAPTVILVSSQISTTPLLIAGAIIVLNSLRMARTEIATSRDRILPE